MFGAILGALAGAAHSAAKGVDEAADIGGAKGIFKMATSSLAEATGRFAESLNNDNGYSIPGRETLGMIGGSIKTALGGMIDAESAPATQGQKLGRSAALYNEVVGTGTAQAQVSSYECNMNDIVCPTLPTTIARSASAGMSA